MSAEASPRGKRNRNRGARAEVQVVNHLRANGFPDARRYLAGDGRQPGDIDWHALICLEVKDVAKSAWPSWCRQAAAEAPPGTVPVVVRRTRGVTDVGLWECRWVEYNAVGFLADYERNEWVSYEGIEGELWCVGRFADLIAAVRALDTEGAQ